MIAAGKSTRAKTSPDPVEDHESMKTLDGNGSGGLITSRPIDRHIGKYHWRDTALLHLQAAIDIQVILYHLIIRVIS